MYNVGKIKPLHDDFKVLNKLKYYIGTSKYMLGPNDVVEPLHIHAELEIILNVSSDISFLVNGNLYPLNAGDIIIAKPNDVHVCVYNSKKKHEMYILWINQADNPILFKDFYKNDFSPKVVFEDKYKSEIFSIFAKLLEVYGKEDRDIEKASLLLRLLDLIKNGRVNASEEKDLPENFQKTLNFINENFSTIYSINDILKENYISYSTLNRLFNSHLKISPKEYLDSVKLSNAVKLLEKGFSVTDACFKSGFTDCSRFITIFKNRFGQTPLNYKKRKEPK